MKLGHTSSLRKPRKYLQRLSSRKIMEIVFWESSTKNSERYCETLTNIRRASNNKRWGKLSSKILFFITMAAHTQPIALKNSWMVSNGRSLTSQNFKHFRNTF